MAVVVVVFVAALVVPVMLIAPVLATVAVFIHRAALGEFQQLVQFSFIEPNAPAVGAIVDLHVVALRHEQRFVAIRAFHRITVYNLQK
ncbi:hypothetical protein WJU22_16235 [Chitinophaga caseinilytica]|uniref:Secreted protein n=1 Tax=Chitinophaga caseinilytica TaxID=2267521 RepID=A0ABZ2YYA7_9BACT